MSATTQPGVMTSAQRTSPLASLNHTIFMKFGPSPLCIQDNYPKYGSSTYTIKQSHSSIRDPVILIMHPSAHNITKYIFNLKSAHKSTYIHIYITIYSFTIQSHNSIINQQGSDPTCNTMELQLTRSALSTNITT